ncbi:hypothetical protein [Burkholderia cenocepacia]|uniref:hypothetical protein n=1 Tax=Burkholderia cenocepacia TaxID=95486 RepID=UPI0022304C0D|nr:hypothetical protein [Burkholderia cenocepacia]MCW3610621.1 hypothetical protein [Burkholderia cenocepacia]MCW5191718.1 hypothetical protein [Burkholderia cenocepacia]
MSKANYIFGFILLVSSILQGCSGGDALPSQPDQNSIDQSLNQQNAQQNQNSMPPPPGNTVLVASGSTPQQKIRNLGSGTGFVASALSEKLPPGTADDYDVLVVSSDQTENPGVMKEIVNSLGSGKEIVIDSASNGKPGGATLNSAVEQIVGPGTAVAGDAVRIQQGPNGDGYLITPIFNNGRVNNNGGSEQNTSSMDATQNNVANIFQINDGGMK